MTLAALYGRPKTVAALVFLFCLIAISGSSRLLLSDDIRDNLDPDSVELKAFLEHEQTFGATNSAMLLIEYSDTVFADDAFRRLADYTALAEDLPQAYRVVSPANTVVIESDNDVIDSNTTETLLLERQYPITKIRDLLMSEREVKGNLVSADGKVAAIQVLFDFEPRQMELKDEINQALYDFRDHIRQQENTDQVFITGSLMIDHAQKLAVERNFAVLVPAVYLVMLVLMMVLFRSVTLMLTVIGCTMLAIVAMLGAGGYVGITLSPISMNAISVMTGIMIAALCHVLVQVAQRIPEMSYEEAVITAMRLNIKPIALTAFTTLVAFLALNLSHIPPLRDLGNMVVLGTVFSLLISLFLFPALLLMFRFRITDFTRWQTGLFRRYGNWVLNNGGMISIVILIMAVALSYASQYNQVRDYFAKYFDDSFEFRVANDYADAHLSGLFHLEYTLEAKSDAGVTDVNYLRTLSEFAQWLESQPEVQHASSFANIIQRMNEVWHDNDPAWYRVPDTNEEAAQFLVVYDLSLPDTHSLTHIVNMTRTASRVVANIPSMPSDELFALEARAQSWLQQHDEHLASYSVTGLTYMLTRIFTEATVSGLQSAVLAFFLISGLLVLVFRSFTLGLVSLIPNLLPFAMALGVWAFLDGNLLVTTSAVVTITLGIVVDDTIHLLHKVRYFVLERQIPVRDAIIKTLEEVGPAIVITTIAMGAGFILLAFSAFLPTVHFGILSTIILLLALWLDLTLMPILLYVGRKWFFPASSGA